MNDMDQSEISGNEKHGSYYALLVAFRTMNERCRQLEKRLGDVEEENMCLRLECGKDESAAITKLTDSSEKTIVQTLKVHITFVSTFAIFILYILIHFNTVRLTGKSRRADETKVSTDSSDLYGSSREPPVMEQVKKIKHHQ